MCNMNEQNDNMTRRFENKIEIPACMKLLQVRQKRVREEVGYRDFPHITKKYLAMKSSLACSGFLLSLTLSSQDGVWTVPSQRDYTRCFSTNPLQLIPCRRRCKSSSNLRYDASLQSLLLAGMIALHSMIDSHRRMYSK